jgi:hypothetical protein
MKKLLEKETNLRKAAEEEVKHLKSQLGQHSQSEVWIFTWFTEFFCISTSGFHELPNM